MPKSKNNIYKVHIGVRLTYDAYVEAESEDEAKDIAEQSFSDGQIEVAEFNFTDDNYDVIDTVDPKDCSGLVIFSNNGWYYGGLTK